MALHQDCYKHFEGFSLSEDYNRNSPPGTHTTIRDVQIINEIVEVCDKISFFNNHILFIELEYDTHICCKN